MYNTDSTDNLQVHLFNYSVHNMYGDFKPSLYQPPNQTYVFDHSTTTYPPKVSDTLTYSSGSRTYISLLSWFLPRDSVRYKFPLSLLRLGRSVLLFLVRLSILLWSSHFPDLRCISLLQFSHPSLIVDTVTTVTQFRVSPTSCFLT